MVKIQMKRDKITRTLSEYYTISGTNEQLDSWNVKRCVQNVFATIGLNSSLIPFGWFKFRPLQVGRLVNSLHNLKC